MMMEQTMTGSLNTILTVLSLIICTRSEPILTLRSIVTDTEKQKQSNKSYAPNYGGLPETLHHNCCNSVSFLAMALPFHAEELQISKKYLTSEIGQIWHRVRQLTSTHWLINTNLQPGEYTTRLQQ